MNSEFKKNFLTSQIKNKVYKKNLGTKIIKFDLLGNLTYLRFMQ